MATDKNSRAYFKFFLKSFFNQSTMNIKVKRTKTPKPVLESVNSVTSAQTPYIIKNLGNESLLFK